MRLLHRLFARNDRLKRWKAVKHLDANAAQRRAVVARNKADVARILGAGK